MREQLEPKDLSNTSHMIPNRRDALLTTYRDGLLNDILPFWIRHSVDREFGGFMTAADRDGRVVDTDKGEWQQLQMSLNVVQVGVAN
ncbi:MAG: hypothetical protein R3C18_25250 [Planctomycetaceae bacterium]